MKIFEFEDEDEKESNDTEFKDVTDKTPVGKSN